MCYETKSVIFPPLFGHSHAARLVQLKIWLPRNHGSKESLKSPLYILKPSEVRYALPDPDILLKSEVGPACPPSILFY